MEHEYILNVSHLEPCEPLERVLEAIETLRPGQYLRMLHNREPFPLYTILEKNGYAHCIRSGNETLFEIFIWREEDDIARTAVRSTLEQQSG